MVVSRCDCGLGNGHTACTALVNQLPTCVKFRWSSARYKFPVANIVIAIIIMKITTTIKVIIKKMIIKEIIINDRPIGLGLPTRESWPKKH